MDVQHKRRVWAEVDLDALDENMRNVRKFVKPDTLITATVKANAYGNGAVIAAKEFLANGADRLAVAVLDEAVELRKAGVTARILILGPTDGDRAEELVNYGIDAAVFHYDTAVAFSNEAVKQNRMINLHIAIDSGMGRIGYRPTGKSIAEIKRISMLPNVVLEGIFTHFAKADTRDKTFTTMQFKKFQWVCQRLEAEQIPIHIHHCCNSAAMIDIPEYQYDMVRPGAILYGYAPSNEVNINKVGVHPVMSLKCCAEHVKMIDKGDTISYGCHFVADGPTKIASLPIGYADGYSRLLSNKATVLVHGQRAPQVGNICMDQCMIDVTKVPDVNIGDEVVLFGTQEKAVLPIEELADELGTIKFEIMSLLARRVPRVYTRSGKVVHYCEYLQQ